MRPGNICWAYSAPQWIWVAFSSALNWNGGIVSHWRTFVSNCIGESTLCAYKESRTFCPHFTICVSLAAWIQMKIFHFHCMSIEDKMQIISSVIQLWITVLVSARIEFVFFWVADIVLCLGFWMRMLLIAHCCFKLLLSNAYTKLDFLASYTAMLPWRLRAHKVLGGDRTRTRWSELAKGRFHMLRHHAKQYNLGELSRCCSGCV